MRLNKHGLTTDETRVLLRLCLRGEWPAQVKLERTGTVYKLGSEVAAARLYVALAGKRRASEVFDPEVMVKLEKDRPFQLSDFNKRV